MAVNEPLFVYEGIVTSGNKIGRRIGIPTLNVLIEENTVLPQFGVYVASVIYNNCIVHGVANLGVKPTIHNPDGSNPVAIEVNLFDFEGDLYDEDVKIFFHKFLRPEMAFDNLEKLADRINRDIKDAKEFLAAYQDDIYKVITKDNEKA